MNYNILAILGKALDIPRLLDEAPNMFDFSNLDIVEKSRLLNEMPARFIPFMSVLPHSVDDKYYLLQNVTHKSVRKAFALSDAELGLLPDSMYMELLKQNFGKYIKVERYKALSEKYKTQVMCMNPKWVLDNIDCLPRITSEILLTIARTQPELFERISADIAKYSTCAGFWSKMIRHDKKYEKMFLSNTKTCITKTDVRQVIRSHPHMIKELDADIIANSKLTVKEWLLLIRSLSGNKALVDWDFSAETKEALKMDSLADVLTGKYKLTKQLSNAIGAVLEDGDQNEDKSLE